MFCIMAWRNIWRNTRRTAVILTAIVIGVWSMILLGSLMRGMLTTMVENGIATLTGHVQVHAKGYRADPVIENSMTSPGRAEAAVNKLLPPGGHWTARVRVNAVASNARHASGVTLVGIDPAKEAKVSFIGRAVNKGRYLKPEDKYGVVVGKALLDKFETRLGHKLVVMSQDTTKQIASRAFTIVGVFRADLEATEKEFIFITMPAAQDMLKLKDGVSEIAVLLPKEDGVAAFAQGLSSALPGSYEVQTWQELQPMLEAYLSIFNGFIAIWNLVIFIAMAFGIVNTTLMAVYERIREFGLLKALGMKPRWIVQEVLTQSLFLLLLGMALGNLLAWLSIRALSGGIDLSAFAAGAEYFGMSRVIFPEIAAGDVVLANVVVFFLGLLVSAYPALKASRFTPVKALAHN